MRLGLGLGNDVYGQSRGGVFGGLLLDQYSGAAAAYSLRKLSSGITNVVRVRRSSDNAEQDFTATEVTDGTLETWVGANDGFVTTWYDQSGNGNDATQSTAANQPKIVDAGVLVEENGLPALNFLDDSSALVGHYLDADYPYAASVVNLWLFSAYSLITNGSFPIIINSSSGAQALTSMHDGSEALVRTITVRSGGTQVYDGSTALTNNQLTLRTDRTNRVQIDTWINGSIQIDAQADDNSDFVIPSKMRIGNTSSTNAKCDTMISEIIIYATDQYANRTAIEGNINSYYNIY